MAPPKEPSKPRLSHRDVMVRLKLVLSWAILAWERLWSRLWIPVALGGVFIALALTDVLQSLPFIIHASFVAVSAGGIGYVGFRVLRGLSWPTRDDAKARLEKTSPVHHRPLTTLEDNLAVNTSALQQEIWAAHKTRAQEDVQRLRPSAPDSGVANQDKYALRAAVFLGLFVAVVGGWTDLGDRMMRSMFPIFGANDASISAKIWITPPPYTEHSPTYIEIPATDKRQTPRTLDIQAGSTLLVMATGSPQKMTLAMGEEILPLDRLADETQRGEVELPRGDRLELRHGSSTVPGWNVNWIPDELPTISFVESPSEANRWRLIINYEASDDHGIEHVFAAITRGGQSTETPLSSPPFSPKTALHSAITDLSAHPWAGENVDLQLIAVDVAGQRGVSPTIPIRLPERIFDHPVSKELAQWRKRLMNNPEDAVRPAADSIATIMQRPVSYGGDPMAHLSLSAVKHRLQNETPADAAATVPDLLWQTAIRIEGGSLAVAEQRLMEAEKALREAMKDGASAEEINKLVDELQAALAEYTRAMAENTPEEQSDFGTADSIAEQDIAALMEQVREMADLGAEDAAQQAFAELEDLLNELRSQPPPGQSASPEVDRARELMDQMRELAAEQAGLLDQNFERTRQQALQDQQGDSSQSRNQQGQSQREGAREAGQQASSQQDALREQLADLLAQMGQITGDRLPESLVEADLAMVEASRALRRGEFDAGVEGQGEALSKLEEGVDDATDMLLEALFEKGFGGLANMPGGQRRFGPLGPRGGRNSGDNVDVPTDPDTEGLSQRVRAILEEIRQRASDRTRPEEEQDYLRRLMKTF